MNDPLAPTALCEACAKQWDDVSCLSCPVCGNEECLVLDQLGNYCETRTAVTLAAKKLATETEKKLAVAS